MITNRKKNDINNYFSSILESASELDENFKISNPMIIAKSDPNNIDIACDNSTYYIESDDLWDFMKYSAIDNVTEAVQQISEYYNIDESDICVIVSENSIIKSDLMNSNITIQEKSTYSDAMTPGAAKAWYRKFIHKMKSGTTTKADIDERIKLLEQCVKKMESARYDGDGGDHVKYVLKSLIPFNGIVRYFKNRDVYAGLSWRVGFIPGFGGLATIVMRAVTYNAMLEDKIEMTNEAI